MKQLIVIFLCFCSISLYGQVPKIGPGIDIQTTALFVNSVYVGHHAGFCTDFIDSIKIVKESIDIDGKIFENQLHCFSSIQFNFISFQELLENCRDENSSITSSIFILNGIIITDENVSSFKIDKNYLLSLKCLNSKDLAYWEGTESFLLISILTRTPENMQKQRESTFSNGLFDTESKKWTRKHTELKEWFSNRREDKSKSEE